MDEHEEDETPPELLTAEEVESLAAWLLESGARAVGAATGAAQGTLTRAAAGLPVRRGSVALIRAALERRPL